MNDYNKILKLNPKDAEAHYSIGVIYYEKGKYDSAITEYDKTIELNPGFADAYNGRGVAYKNIGQYDKAIADFDKAIVINPSDETFYKNRGNAYYKKGLYEQAMFDYNKAIEINPKTPDCYLYLAKADIFEKKNDVDNAISAYEDFIKYADRFFYANIIDQVEKNIERLKMSKGAE